MNRTTLRRLRKRLRLSVARAAAQVHVTPRAWTYYESGERKIPEAIAHLFCLLNGLPYRPKRS